MTITAYSPNFLKTLRQQRKWSKHTAISFNCTPMGQLHNKTQQNQVHFCFGHNNIFCGCKTNTIIKRTFFVFLPPFFVWVFASLKSTAIIYFQLVFTKLFYNHCLFCIHTFVFSVGATSTTCSGLGAT